MQIRPTKSPWESSFENLTSGVRRSVKKVVTDATKTIAADVKQQVVGEPAVAEALAGKQAAQQQLQGVEKQVKPEEQKKLQEWRRNLANLEAEIKRVREERLKKEQESRRVEEKKKAADAKAMAAKKEEPVWKKMMKMGSQAERKVNAGG